jgi:glycosyltransferase involved in cell wall biosynthesis
MKKLSIIIPIHNEAKTLEKILSKVIELNLPNMIGKEIILINDGSTDSSLEIIKRFSRKNNNIKYITNIKNLGKSQTVKKGIINSTGDYIIIQDADLEYEPKDIPTLINSALSNNLEVVYGNRFSKNLKIIYLENYIGNRLLSFISNIFTYPRLKVWIPDMEVCYKLIEGTIARKIAKNIESISSFGFEPEVTAKLSKYKDKNKRHLKFGVVYINYYPRTKKEGKHMKAFKDGFKALKEIIIFNILK